jgi:hypothetical protein
MALTTGMAILGAAGIGAIAGAVGSSKQSKAVRNASQITQADNAANRAFQTDIYNRNAGYLAPWQASGQTANSAFMELLGYPAAQPQPAAFGTYGAAPMATPSAFGGYPFAANDGGMGELRFDNERFGDQMPVGAGFGGGFDGGTYGNQQFGPPQPVPGGVTVPRPSARSAFDNYRGSTGYDFRFNEGVRALQSAFSRNRESGAADKAAMRFGQDIASDEFGRYMDLLRGQSQLGLSGASALAGVGQNFGNTVTAGNQSAASAAANARLYSGNLAAQNWANIGSSFGNALGYLAR